MVSNLIKLIGCEISDVLFVLSFLCGVWFCDYVEFIVLMEGVGLLVLGVDEEYERGY